MNTEYMTVEVLMDKNIDADVGNKVLDIEIPAFCGPIKILPKAKKEWADVLNQTVTIHYSQDNYQTTWIMLNAENEEDVRRARRFFLALAGYCSQENFDKWFKI